VLRSVFGKRYSRSLGLHGRTEWTQSTFSSRGLRGVQTHSLPQSASQGILNEQRLKRPSSPHFTIYQPQLTWLGSIAHRVTGASLSAREFPFLPSARHLLHMKRMVLT
jgi:hypothetical protein